MFQIRIHGRGGQGVVSAAEMLSVAAFEEGKHSQAVPSFGSERMGAPVVAYVRIDDKEIELREPVLEPDLLIVQDPTLFSAIDVFAGLRKDGYLLVNTAKSMDELGISEAAEQLPNDNIAAVPATELAMHHLKRPTPNTVLLGAFTAMSDVVKIDSVFKAIARKFPGKVGEMNIAAAQAAYDAALAN
ncbi:MAG: 2-oxoacid:acceptor oxidoreductase [Alphaproteobacteria bacterium]|nr:2-oxoacid:acceptor oxidoreductase [Alphaproteobacteria bacterium]MBT4085125.1 2-oxoacid:acceptor oxidoreductase [Alphaproteobacteria bacterium]MBT4543259.1 2-oxoacid:acceptor oxidoreductase [Alphaproteobacteria bacterium]